MLLGCLLDLLRSWEQAEAHPSGPQTSSKGWFVNQTPVVADLYVDFTLTAELRGPTCGEEMFSQTPVSLSSYKGAPLKGHCYECVASGVQV